MAFRCGLAPVSLPTLPADFPAGRAPPHCSHCEDGCSCCPAPQRMTCSLSPWLRLTATFTRGGLVRERLLPCVQVPSLPKVNCPSVSPVTGDSKTGSGAIRCHPNLSWVSAARQ